MNKTLKTLLKTLPMALLLGTAMLATAFAAGPEVPPSGLRAEMDQRWDDALHVYRQALRTDPMRADLWKRIADIEARRGNYELAADALASAVALRPDDHAFQFELSRAYAQAQQPVKALSACRAASRLAAENLDYHRACGQQAMWADNLAAAEEHFNVILNAQPNDENARLGLARIQSWRGKLDQSAKEFRAYLDQHPGDKGVWIDYIKVETWRGNYARAIEALAEYAERFGEDDLSNRAKARVLAWLAWAEGAHALNDPLLAKQADDYELHYTRSIALKTGRRPAEAVESLETIKRLRPESRETETLQRFVKTSLRSNINLGWFYYDDSDQITIKRWELYGGIFLSPNTEIRAGIEDERMRADIGTGLETIDGNERIDHDKYWIGIKHRFGPALEVSARGGEGDIQDGGDYRLFRGRLDWNPSDTLAFGLQYDRDLYALSPRSVSLEIVQKEWRLRSDWQPNERWWVTAELARSRFSDDNERYEWVIAPRRVMLRREKFNLDLGVSAQGFGFDDNLDHGYYDPEDYRRYAVTAFGYWKFSDDDGLSMSASAGWHKDESMGSYEFGHDVVLDGFFGIYRDWMFRLRLAYADRNNQVGSYDGFSAHGTLTWRF